MADFYVRIVLNGNASRATYSSLRQVLAGIGVVDFIQGDNGQWYRLPDAEYRTSANMTHAALRDALIPHVAGVWADSAILVAATNGVAWTGLVQIPGPA